MALRVRVQLYLRSYFWKYESTKVRKYFQSTFESTTYTYSTCTRAVLYLRRHSVRRVEDQSSIASCLSTSAALAVVAGRCTNLDPTNIRP